MPLRPRLPPSRGLTPENTKPLKKTSSARGPQITTRTKLPIMAVPSSMISSGTGSGLRLSQPITSSRPPYRPAKIRLAASTTSGRMSGSMPLKAGGRSPRLPRDTPYLNGPTIEDARISMTPRRHSYYGEARTRLWVGTRSPVNDYKHHQTGDDQGYPYSHVGGLPGDGLCCTLTSAIHLSHQRYVPMPNDRSDACVQSGLNIPASCPRIIQWGR